MLKIEAETLAHLDEQYPGIRGSILRFESARLPDCPRCGGSDTAKVECGILGRTITIAAATTKVRFVPSKPKPGELYCNACCSFFG